MKELPKFFVIKKEADNPLWGKYIEWMKKNYNINWEHTRVHNYYGYNGYSGVAFKGDLFLSPYPTVITLEQWDEIVNGFVLPEQWVVKVGDDNKTSIFSQWRETTKYGEYLGSKGYLRENGFFLSHYPLYIPEITFEQFKKHVLKQETIGIPENINFYVEYSKEFTEDLYNKLVEWSKTNSIGKPRDYNDSYEGLKTHKYFFIFNNWGINSYKVISIENIKRDITYGVDNNIQNCIHKYSIKEIKELINYKETMDKKIIGYKLKDGCEKYLPILDKISSYFSENFNEEGNKPILYNSNYYNDFKNAHVLDLWFEPIYDNKPDITINGYKAEFFDTYVKFGCVEINKKVFIDICHTTKYTNTNREVESITIGSGFFSKEDIKQIVEYYEESI